MSLYALRYRPDTPLGRKFTQITLHTYDDEKTAERVRDMCPNRDAIEVVEVDEQGHESASRAGETGSMSVVNRPPGGVDAPSIPGALPTKEESTR